MTNGANERRGDVTLRREGLITFAFVRSSWLNGLGACRVITVGQGPVGPPIPLGEAFNEKFAFCRPTRRLRGPAPYRPNVSGQWAGSSADRAARTAAVHEPE